jgi:hypothetical protein
VECRIFPEKCSRNEKYLGVAEFAHIVLHLGFDFCEIQSTSLPTSQNNLLDIKRGCFEKLGGLPQKFLVIRKQKYSSVALLTHMSTSLGLRRTGINA